jgi:hypothetical protein
MSLSEFPAVYPRNSLTERDFEGKLYLSSFPMKREVCGEAADLKALKI